MGLCLWVHWRFIDSYFPPNCLTRIFLGYQFQNGSDFCYFCNMVVGIRFLDVLQDARATNSIDEMEWKGVIHSTKFAYAEVWKTLKQIRVEFPVLFLFIIAYLLFYDGVNTINGMASAFGESVLENQSNNEHCFTVNSKFCRCSNEYCIW